MDHRGLQRPSLPGSTPAPGPKGLKNVYSSRIPPHLEPAPPQQPQPQPQSQHQQQMQPAGDQSPAPSPQYVQTNRPFSSEPAPPRPGTGQSALTDADRINVLHDLDAQSQGVAASLTSSQARKVQVTSDRLNQRLMQQKVMTKIVAKLPFQLRESVSAVLTMAFSASENIQKDLDVSHQEVMALRAELFRRSAEVSTLRKTCAIYQEQLRGLRENVESLKDNVEARQKFTIKNRSAMTRLAATNRMLIDALDALQGNAQGAAAATGLAAAMSAAPLRQVALSTPKTHGPDGGFFAERSASTSAASAAASSVTGDAQQLRLEAMMARALPPKTHQLKPLQTAPGPSTAKLLRTASASSPVALERTASQGRLAVGAAAAAAAGEDDADQTLLLQQQYQEKQQMMTLSQNDKLRESLLKIAREHYRSLKTAEHLSGRVAELAAALKRQEHISRKLQTELEEYKRANDLASPFSVSAEPSVAGNERKPSMKFSTAAMVAVAALKTQQQIYHPLVAGSGGGGGGGGGGVNNSHKQFSASSSIARALRHAQPPRDRFGILDERLAQLVARGMVDPAEAVLTLRRIVQRVVLCGSHLVAGGGGGGGAQSSQSSSVGVSLSLRAMLRDVADRDTAAVFRTDVVNVYLLRPALDAAAPGGVRYALQKFSSHGTATVAAGAAEVFDDVGDLRASRSLALQTMRTGKAMRLNVLTTNSLFDRHVDGAGTGVAAKRLLAVPLFAASDVAQLHGGGAARAMAAGDAPAALGCLVFINKHARARRRRRLRRCRRRRRRRRGPRRRPQRRRVGHRVDGHRCGGCCCGGGGCGRRRAGGAALLDNEPFSEADEVLALVFAQLVSLLLLHAVRYDALFHHSQLLRALLQATLHDADLDASALTARGPPPTAKATATATVASEGGAVAAAAAAAAAGARHEPLVLPAGARLPRRATTNVAALLRDLRADRRGGGRVGSAMAAEDFEALFAFNCHAATAERAGRFEWLYLDPQNRRHRDAAGDAHGRRPKRLRTTR
eukprot:gene16870-12075_t